MTVEQIRNKFLSNPSYLRKGAGYLSRFWKVSPILITEVRNAIRKEKSSNKTLINSNKPPIRSSSIKENTNNNLPALLTVQSDRPLSPQEIAVFAQVDGISSFVSNYWLKSHKNGTYTYSVQVRTQKEDIFGSILEAIENLKFDFPKYPKVQSTDSFLVISLSDLHFDKKSYIEEKDNVLL